MIPKIIHYCWLSDDPIPFELQKCMNSWSKFLPDYEIKLWNFDVFDKSSSEWVSEAYDAKKYAFAADYIRLYALYNYGGIYLDMDVEVVKPFDVFLDQHEILCWQKGGGLEVAAFGAEKGALWIGKCLEYYEKKHFVMENGSFNTKPLPTVVEDVLRKNKFEIKNINNRDCYDAKCRNDVVQVLPSDFFSPKSYMTGKILLTQNTVCIHHFSGSWLPWYETFEMWVCRKFKLKNRYIIKKIFSKITQKNESFTFDL